jgi:hypothetical protein
VARTPTERLGEIDKTLERLDERVNLLRVDLTYARSRTDELERSLAELRTEVALVRQLAEELKRHRDETTKWWWGVLGLFCGSLLAFGGNLAIALLRK